MDFPKGKVPLMVTFLHRIWKAKKSRGRLVLNNVTASFFIEIIALNEIVECVIYAPVHAGIFHALLFPGSPHQSLIMKYENDVEELILLFLLVDWWEENC